ncbi:MAG: zinc ribbon domain-containing protein [Clostridia bacterium]|nr:zinc ribbon domain-containing protein [Clostridia bacterium]
MDFFESAKKAATEAAGVVAEKSAEIIDLSKTKYKIFELKSDIKKLYTEIGKLTYDALTDGKSHGDEIQQMCDVITEKKGKISRLESGTDDIDFKCPSCGRETSGDNKTCPSCGADMTTDADIEIMD